jgi:hypothetical protein
MASQTLEQHWHAVGGQQRKLNSWILHAEIPDCVRGPSQHCSTVAMLSNRAYDQATPAFCEHGGLRSFNLSSPSETEVTERSATLGTNCGGLVPHTSEQYAHSTMVDDSGFALSRRRSEVGYACCTVLQNVLLLRASFHRCQDQLQGPSLCQNRCRGCVVLPAPAFGAQELRDSAVDFQTIGVL